MPQIAEKHCENIKSFSKINNNGNYWKEDISLVNELKIVYVRKLI